MTTPDEMGRLDAWWRAANYLSVGQIYLLDNPLLREPLRIEHVKPRLLGHWGTSPGLNLVYAHMNRAIRARDVEALFVTGPGHGGPALVASAWLDGTYSEVYPEVTRDGDGHAAAVPPVLVPGRDPQPRGARDARLHPRGRRARVRPDPRLRGGARQPGPGRVLRRGRRRGRDRPARGELALQQVPGPRRRRGGAAGAAPERLQDRQPDGARADPPRGARRPAARLRPLADPRGGRRPRRGPRAHGRGARRGPRRHRGDPGRRPGRRGRGDPAGVAHDRAAHAEGLDRPEGGGRQAHRGDVALPPGAAGGHGGPARPRRAARDVDALVPPGGALRRGRAPARRPAGPRPGGAAPDERQPARQRRRPAAAARDARHARLRRRGGRAGRRDGVRHHRAGRLPARRDGAERGPPQLPDHGARRDGVEPAAGRLRRHRPRLGRRRSSRPTTTWHPAAG